MLAIQVVSYQTASEVEALVDSLRRHPPAVPWHLVIIDNGSPDGSVARLVELYGDTFDVTVVTEPVNLGFGGAHSKTAATLPTPYVAFLNPDCLIETNGLTACVRYLEEQPEVGVVGPLLLQLNGEVENTAYAFPNPWSAVAGRKSFLRKLWPNNPLSRRYLLSDHSPTEIRHPDWLAGTCMVVRREEFLSLGGFDPRYFVYWEDCDLCWRYKKERNQTTAFLPVGRIVHSRDAAAGKVKPQAIRYFHRSAYHLVKAHIAPQPWNPIRWFAWAALGLRARLQLARGR